MMETSVIQRIQRSLLLKRQNLTTWLSSTPPPKKQMLLGTADEGQFKEHLRVIDAALEKTDDKSLGCCEVCCEPVNSELLEMDYTSCVCLDHFSDQERSQLETELEFLQTVQKASLPLGTPKIPGMEVAAFSRPAQIVSGDYFDFFRFKDGDPGLTIADAMGHGVSASMLIASIQTALRTLVPESSSPAEILQRVNRVFLHNINLTTFITTFLAKLDPAARSLTYCNAGHNPPLLYRQNEGKTNWLEPTGAAIGLIEGYEISTRSVSLSDGDILLLYTDGVTEATNPREVPFGSSRLAEVVSRSAHISAQDLLQAIRQELSEFTGVGVPQDDITLVACKVQT